MKSIFVKSAKLLTLTILLTVNIIYAQNNGGMLITDDNSYTKSDNAALDIYSINNKGFLIPRISYDQMLNLQPLKDGLTVYVIDAVNNGFWYWDSIEDSEEANPQGEWVRLRSEPGDVEPVKAPDEAIIMYSGPLSYFKQTGDSIGAGKEGTIMEGWYLCNGINGTPDLTGRFIVGRDPANTDYNQIGNNNSHNLDSIQLNINDLPEHTHPGAAGNINIAHKHLLTDYTHCHSLDAVYGSFGDPVRISSRKNPPAGREGEIDTESAKMNLGSNTSSSPATITLNFPTNYILNEGAKPDGTTAKIENRPNYYVLAFIIRKF